MADSKKYDGSQWEHSLRKLTTATESVENPLYSDGTAITAYTLKGNTVQNGTPTPANPVDVVGVGTLDSGQYKIPISSPVVTTNIYLGSTQTVRQVKKIVFDGTENWSNQNVGQHGAVSIRKDELPLAPDMPAGTLNILSTHFKAISNSSQLDIGEMVAGGSYLNFDYDGTNNLTDFKAFLATQYANGTPVIVYYVLATPETAAVNEPLMKIGTYIDTLSNATAIPTTDGANSITVDTTVQPSEFTATWTGWHNATVKEWDGSQWNE